MNLTRYGTWVNPSVLFSSLFTKETKSSFSPIITPEGLDKQIDQFKEAIACLSGVASFDDAIQVIAQRVIKLDNIFKIEYENGFLLRLTTKIKLNFPYLELSQKDKQGFYDLVNQANDFYAIGNTIAYTTAKTGLTALRFTMYCFDEQPEGFKETLEQVDKMLTQLKKSLLDYSKKGICSTTAKQPLKTPIRQAAKSESFGDFFYHDLLCLNTFNMMPKLEQLSAKLVLKNSSTSQFPLFKVQQNLKTQAFVLKALYETSLSFSTDYCDKFIEQENLVKSMNDLADALEPNDLNIALKNDLQSFSLPEWETYTLAETGPLKGGDDLKDHFQKFMTLAQNMAPALKQANS